LSARAQPLGTASLPQLPPLHHPAKLAPTPFSARGHGVDIDDPEGTFAREDEAGYSQAAGHGRKSPSGSELPCRVQRGDIASHRRMGHPPKPGLK